MGDSDSWLDEEKTTSGIARSRMSAYYAGMGNQPTIQLKHICQQLGIRERDARYVLEEGHIPHGVDQAPDSGNYRRFNPRQAFWLIVLLKLKTLGLKTPLAAKIANYAEDSMQNVAQSLGWDRQFFPKGGRFKTDFQYFVEVTEVGGGYCIRFGTDAYPGKKTYTFDWHEVDRPGKPLKGVTPCAIIRLDLAQIAKHLDAAFAVDKAE